MKNGACSYLTKFFDHQDLLLQIERALENQTLNFEIKRLKELLEEQYRFTNIVAEVKR
jgi:DNA-binding NtrC family response regulator